MAGVALIAEEHHRALTRYGTSARTGYAVAGVAMAISTVLRVWNPDLIRFESAPTTLIAVAGIMAALLFSLQVSLYERSIDAEDLGMRSERARRLEAIAAHAAYESVLALSILASLVAAELLQGVRWIATPLSIAALGLTALFLSTAMLVAHRVMVDTLDRFRSARTR